jgi:hypothetical protein
VEIRNQLAAAGKPVLLSFSCGKDSIAAWLALRDAGVEVVPAYLYYVPGLRFIDDELAYFEDVFGQRIHQFPHPSLYRWLGSRVFQAPERLRVLEAAGMPVPEYDELWDLIRADLKLPKATLVADGVRASDSIVRRAAFVKYGLLKRSKRKVSPVADWLKAEVMGRIEQAKIELPVDYKWFGRSFDGVDARFAGPLREHDPEDFEILKSWFPLVEADLVRQSC